MKMQPRYPVRFMQMNPDQSMQQVRRGSEAERAREMTDCKRAFTSRDLQKLTSNSRETGYHRLLRCSGRMGIHSSHTSSRGRKDDRVSRPEANCRS
jgi:hypothetical protein